mmetsp:Transcript_19599/g.32235  ORF Transcript_19599/g.32235 Transcript_19599/m.32235 type:complete len:206 (+) Transcript_19599:168-785(+)|eukprot:CAMPEP_0203747476 /NCGR_PEP_ID=MMETSP0098-20131031/2605_1 /ASSEMBLY_ACC=CAM_ASM_000208 /TAXON_ID=96639 /ORGANISM=" , Strain NY0313808BC1" /LENGTH=205 /DNA_ID=CAMNT_0050635901 /DNA_START=185 /DNA_END=802 /DNA_ORIENTATION=-
MDQDPAAGTHPLESSWCFWEHRKGNNHDYGSKMYKLGEFNTAEGFWRFKNNLPKPSDVFYTQQGGQKKFEDREIDGFSMFKSGIRPEWEDKANMHGAEFFCRQAMAPDNLDDAWEKLLLGLISEVIDPTDEVCGVRVVDKSKQGRSTYRLEMWFKTRDKEMCDSLRQRLTKCLGMNLLKEFMEHNVAMTNHGGGKRGGSNRNLNR